MGAFAIDAALPLPMVLAWLPTIGGILISFNCAQRLFFYRVRILGGKAIRAG